MLRAARPAAPLQERPRLLFFYRQRDGAARRAEGQLAKVLQGRRNHDTFLVHRIEVDDRADLAERFRVTETPTFIVVAEGKVRARFARPSGSAAIQVHLQPWLR